MMEAAAPVIAPALVLKTAMMIGTRCYSLAESLKDKIDQARHNKKQCVFGKGFHIYQRARH